MPPKKQVNKAGPQGGYNKGKPIANGEVLTDLTGKQWKLGKSIGSGGFGDIYLASDDITEPVTDKASYVMKIEPYTNGPLFVEIAFYLRVAKPDFIDDWKQKHKLDTLGMPPYIASGTHDYRSQKYRFLIIPRYGQDLHKVIQNKPGKRLGIRTVLAVALQVVDTYEYIHSKAYVHADVKASNLALEYLTNPRKKNAQQIYLLDYGLSLKCVDANGVHMLYEPDARKAHNGTLEYASRDAHIGAFSRRGDLEVLGYNMLEWLCGRLPWSSEDPPDKTHNLKQIFMSDLNLKKIYPLEIPGLDIVEKFLRYVAKLPFNEKPNYSHCREILKKGLPSSPKSSLFLDDVGACASPSKKKKTATKRRAEHDIDSIAKRICLPQIEEENPKRSTRTTKKVKDFNWANVLSTDPEKIFRAAASLSQQAISGKLGVNGRKQQSPIANPTPAMLQILSKKKENMRSPIRGKIPPLAEGTSELTPAMREIVMLKKKKKTATIAAAKSRPGPTANTRSRRCNI